MCALVTGVQTCALPISPVGRGRAWRTADARATCAARCVPAVSADVAWPAAMRPTPAASTLSEFRWRMWAVCRRWVAPVCAGTARAWRTPDDGLLGGAFWPFQDRAFPLGALPLPLPSPLAFVGSQIGRAHV